MVRSTDSSTTASDADPAAETPPTPGSAPVASTGNSGTPAQSKDENTVLLAPQSPMTTLEIPVEGDEPIRIVADGTPVPVAQVEHVVTRAALCREGVVAITPEGRVLLAPASA